MTGHAPAGPSILVVDDYPANVALIEGILRRAGMNNVATEIDPRNVLPRLAHLRPDLIILDLEMPHLTGFQVLRQIRASIASKSVPVMIMTIDTTTAIVEHALAAGAQLVMIKPFDNANLLEHVRQLLDSGSTDSLPGTPTVADRHIDLPKVLDLARHPEAPAATDHGPASADATAEIVAAAAAGDQITVTTTDKSGLVRGIAFTG